MAPFKLLTLLFLLFANTFLLAQDTLATSHLGQDTSTVVEENTLDAEEDFSVGLLFFALVGAGFMLVSIGIGAALTALAVLIIVGLISFGVITTSVLVGLHQNSLIKGFKTFIMLASVIGTTVIGGFAFWFINKLGDWWSEKFAILSGAATGLVAGLMLGFVALYVFQKLTAYFKEKFA